VGPLFVSLAHEAAAETGPEEHEEAPVRRMLSAYFRAAKPQRRSLGEPQDALFADLSPAQVVALERFLATIRQTGRCVVITDLDGMLTAFSGSDLEQDTIEVLASYLAAGGVLAFSTDTAFDWFYARLLRPLVVELGPRSRLLARVLLILSGGTQIFIFQDGAYRLASGSAGRDRSRALDALVELSNERRFPGVPEIDPEGAVYLGDSFTPGGIDHAMADRVGMVIDVGDAMLENPDQPISNLHRAYLRTLEVLTAATAALNASSGTTLQESSLEVADTVLWTFERQQFPPGRRLRVRVRGSGFVHAGVTGEDGIWDPVYNVPLVPLAKGGYEAVLPSGVNAFTFFWTETPWTLRHPGHWEAGPRGARVFAATGK
jgi:hypothetical protein